MIIDVLALLEIIAVGAETVEAIEDLLAALGIEPARDYADLTDEEKLTILKDCTRIVANLNLDLNCFPMGEATTICFDLDGNPIP